MRYEGEHLLIGQLGHFFVLLILASALVSAYAFFRSTRLAGAPEDKGWIRLGRVSYLISAISVVAVFLILFLIIYNHYFEYQYAHQHSKRSLDMQYLLSCFWEGQEGSFMLWAFWQSVLGLVIIRTAGHKWESPVMVIIALAQFFLATFLIGIYFSDLRIGTSPFVLMRHEFADAPIFKDPQYLSKYLTDGNGLNVLLQNYWMVIHPPVLFLGFASTVVPFSYALAGLWIKDHGGWIKPALKWSLFSGGVLGLGIMMGAAWAYESLTFGGYWAWDPVENASMVPWLMLVAGIHTMLVYKSTGHSVKASYLFSSGAYLLTLYSTFLTRTGVLGDTSVHSFTGEGNTLYGHMIVMMLVFLGLCIFLFVRERKAIPEIRKEEQMSSREFWMFVGALLFFIAGIYIIILTSLPFINQLFGTKWAIGQEVEYVYNRVMVLVAFIIGILTAVTQYLRYKETPMKAFWSKLMAPTIATLVVSLLVSLFGKVQYDKFGIGFLVAIHMALWGAFYSVIANGTYIVSVLKGNLKAAGASIAHLGFGLMLVGILISSSKKELVSFNQTGVMVQGLKDVKGREENPLENVTLIHGVPTPMGKYTVTYRGDSTEKKNNKVFFKIDFSDVDTATGKVREQFEVTPDAFVMKSAQGTQLSSNPGSKHYLTRDVFVYITSWLNPDNIEDTASFREHPVKQGDTVFYTNGYMVVEQLVAANKHDNAGLPVVDSAWMSDVSVFVKDGRKFSMQPALFVKDNTLSHKLDTLAQQSLILGLNRDARGQLTLGVKESDAVLRYITLKAYKFPFINVLWLGTLVMVAGFMISLYRRYGLDRRKTR
jgi:cytochrome c-type biogenesis protein CcmF